MSLKVPKGHFHVLKIKFFSGILCLKSEFCMIANIIKKYFLHNMKFELKGHIEGHISLLLNFVNIYFFFHIVFSTIKVPRVEFFMS